MYIRLHIFTWIFLEHSKFVKCFGENLAQTDRQMRLGFWIIIISEYDILLFQRIMPKVSVHSQ